MSRFGELEYLLERSPYLCPYALLLKWTQLAAANGVGKALQETPPAALDYIRAEMRAYTVMPLEQLSGYDVRRVLSQLHVRRGPMSHYAFDAFQLLMGYNIDVSMYGRVPNQSTREENLELYEILRNQRVGADLERLLRRRSHQA